MATEVKLPDLGEGVEEASISRWLVKEGDTVQAGDPILEVATDKVDTEMPSPVSGKILKIRVRENEIASAGSVLAIIGADGESAETAAEAPPATPQPVPADTLQPPAEPSAEPPADDQAVKATPVAKRVAADRGVPLSGIAGSGRGGQITKEDVLAQADGSAAKTTDDTATTTTIDEARPDALPGDLANIVSLEVRRLIADYNLDLAAVAAGRPLSTLTRYDVLNFAASQAAGAPTEEDTHFLPPKGWTQAQPSAVTPASIQASTATTAPAKVADPARPSGGEELVKPNRMRQLIAKNTLESLQSSAQLTTWHDVDMTAVVNHRKAHKTEFAAAGVNLTITAYLIAATVEGLKAVPAANSMWTNDGILIRYAYHIGMAASLPADKYGLGGLIVPVIKNADDLNLQGIARQVNTLGEKARANKLTGEDLQGGTFTLTNYGTSGSVFQTPIIHQGQAGILGTGTIEKRPVVVSNGSPLEANLGDYLTFKPMMTLAFTFDHRVLDGATADAFCVAVKKTLEHWQ